jgi:hypothetical protein
MAVKSLRIDFLSNGADQVRTEISSVGADVDKFGKKTANAKVGLDDKTIAPKIAELQRKLDLIAKKKAVATADVNDSAGKAKLITMSASLDKLSRVVANPNISLRGADKALADIYRVDAAMDRLSKKSAKIKIDDTGTSKVSLLSRLSSLTPSIGSAGVAAGSDATQVGGGAAADTADSGPIGGYAIGGAVALGTSLLPALTPMVIGVGTALGGVLAAALVNKGFAAKLSSQLPIFEKILETATQPVVKAVDAMLPQIDKFATSMGPELAQAFSASMPFLRMFVSVLEQAGKILLPAFTTSMKQMTPFIPQLVQGFVTLTKGVAQLILLMGPEMSNSVIMFDGVMKGAQIALNVLGDVIDIVTGFMHLDAQAIQALGRVVVDVFQGKFGAAWALIKKFGSDIANTFDTLRHTVAVSLGNMGFDAWGHQVADLFDTARHNVAQWSSDFTATMIHTWGNVENVTTGSIKDIENWMTTGWNSVYSNTARTWGTIFNFFKGIWGNIENVTTGSVKDIENWISTGWNSVYSNTSRTWSLISNGLSSSWNTIKSVASSSVGWIRTELSNAWNDMASDAKRIWSGIASGIATAFNAVKSAFTTPINGILGIIDDADKLLNHIPGISLPTTLHLAQGGLVTVGTTSTADDVPALISKGETVVSAAHSRLLTPVFRSVGVPGYAAGGVPLPGSPAAAAAAINQGNAKEKALLSTENGAGVFSGLLKALGSLTADVLGSTFGKLLNALPGNGLGLTVAKAVGTDLINALKNVLTGAQAQQGSGPAGLGVSGGEMANGRQLYSYLLQNVFQGHKIAAAGAIASIWGESTWNPFAQGTGGRGLIGWTPPGSIPNADFSGGMATQLPAIVRFIGTSGDWGVIREMEGASSILEAANLWGKGVERYGINDVHAEGLDLAAQIMGQSPTQIAAQTAAANTSAGSFNGYAYANGGWINETVLGKGMRSGSNYLFGENGPEWVVPQNRMVSGSSDGGGGDVYITVQGDTDPDGAALRIQQKLRDLKRHRGGQPLGLD